MFKHILMPIDGSELSQKAVEEGLKLAKCVNARVTALVAEPEYAVPTYSEMVSHAAVTLEEHQSQARSHAETILNRVAERAREAGVDFRGKFCEEDHPYAAIIREASEGACDLIVMASHGRHGLSAVLFGSETHEVMAHSRIPVLVYR
jgi:nucleotide-binding universal stress UspA family protein